MCFRWLILMFGTDWNIKGLQTLKSAHFDTESSQVWQWKIDPHNPTVSKMVWTCPNRSQTSKLIIGNTFWNSISDTRITLKKDHQPPSLKKKFPCWWKKISEFFICVRTSLLDTLNGCREKSVKAQKTSKTSIFHVHLNDTRQVVDAHIFFSSWKLAKEWPP